MQLNTTIPTLWKQYRRFAFVLLFVALLLMALQWTGLRQNFSLAFLRQTLSGNRWEGLALFVLLFLIGNLAQVPGWIFLASAVLVLGKLTRRLLSRLHAHPVRNVVVLRTLFQTLAVLNYTLALSGIGFRKYMAGTLLGLPLPIAVYCLLFDSIAKFAHLG
jgi:uncharacterized membrane protein YdjX (TVP38/TMEM64 family)